MSGGDTPGPLPTHHIFLHEIPKQPAGAKVRFLGWSVTSLPPSTHLPSVDTQPRTQRHHLRRRNGDTRPRTRLPRRCRRPPTTPRQGGYHAHPRERQGGPAAQRDVAECHWVCYSGCDEGAEGAGVRGIRDGAGRGRGK